jgi:hypothetical protein
MAELSSETHDALLERVDRVETHVDANGTDEEKKDLMPKLVDLRQAISDLTVHYDARLSEVKERNQQALAELRKLATKVKCAHEHVPEKSKVANHEKENCSNGAVQREVPAGVPADASPPAPLRVPRAVPVWEPASNWAPEYSDEYGWWVPVSGGPTCPSEFFPDVPWAEISGSPGVGTPKSRMSFIPTPSPDWSVGVVPPGSLFFPCGESP